MHFDFNIRGEVTDRIREVVQEMQGWNDTHPAEEQDVSACMEQVVLFDHCAKPDRPFFIGGADGSGDMPSVSYGDTIVYLITAVARIYEALPAGYLSEREVSDGTVFDLLWLPQDGERAKAQFLKTFERLIGEPLTGVCERSDYYELTKKRGARVSSPTDLVGQLIFPEAHSSENISIQLLSTAEAGSLIRLMRSLDTGAVREKPIYLLEDTTLALPMIGKSSTLFFEIAKRYACTVARNLGITFLTLSKSHNFPHMDTIEDSIKETHKRNEHWFFRVPKNLSDKFLGTRTIPPVGAESYIFKLHDPQQPMRIDMDQEFWKTHIWDEDAAIMRRNEIQLFRDLDFSSHDQRCCGYPYPVKACHDRASLTDQERLSLRKQFIDEAVKNGFKRQNFIDAGILTGHK